MPQDSYNFRRWKNTGKKITSTTRGIQKVMHSKALLLQDFTNLVYIWHKHDRKHLFAIVICFSFIFRFLKLKLDLEMAALFEAHQKQRAVIEFLVAEGETSLKIHNQMKNVYKDNTIDYSNVTRWVQRFKKSTEDHEEVGKASIADKPRSGRPSTSVNPDNKTYADELIRTDRRITVEELAFKLDVSIGSAHSIVASLGYSKVCASWVHRQLTEDHKTSIRYQDHGGHHFIWMDCDTTSTIFS